VRPHSRQTSIRADGWNTVLLDHFSCQVVDYPKEAAYYAALMNWPIRSDDGKQAVLDIGDWGGLVLRGGYQRRRPHRRLQPTRQAGGRGGGRGGPRAPPSRRVRRVLLGHRSVGRETRGKRNSGSAVSRRWPTTRGRDFQSFHVKDPDGFDLQISNGNGRTGVRVPASAKTAAGGTVRADELEDGLARSHLVRGVPELQGDGRVLSRAARLEARGRRGQPEPMSDRRGRRHHHPSRRLAGIAAPLHRPRRPARRAAMGHISFGIAAFDPDQVKGELEKRGLTAREDTGGSGRHSHRALQELPHDDAERVRSANQRDDEIEPRRVVTRLHLSRPSWS